MSDEGRDSEANFPSAPVEDDFAAQFGNGDEEVFGVIDPTAIASARGKPTTVGKRGRRASGRRGEDEDEDEVDDEDGDAYTESEEEGSDSDDSEGSDDEYNDDYEDEDNADDDYDEDDDEDNYGRNRKSKGSRGGYGHFSSGGDSLRYQAARVIVQPQLPPVLAALTDNIVQQKRQIFMQQQAQGTAHASQQTSFGTSPSLTAAQLQEMARNAVSSLAAATVTASDSNKSLPILLPRNPEATENIREHVSQELKQSIASMLMNPELRAALIARLHATRSQAQPQPQTASHPRPRPPQQRHREEDDDEPVGTIAATRSRRQTKTVDYTSYFREDSIEESPESEHTSIDRDSEARKSPLTPNGKRRGRPPKNESSRSDAGQTKTARRQRHMYDEGSSDEEFDDAGSVASDESGEPGIEKILSHRVVKGKDEFLVKWHRLAYAHVEWIAKEEILSESGGASRVSRFLNKPLRHHHFDDKNVFNPEFTQIDRIMYGWSHPSADNSNVMETSYLVKWRALPADQATWEKQKTVEELPEGRDNIAQYEAIPDPWKKRQGALPVGRRPETSSWRRLEESPVYKSENKLRAYQLEGLNWLVYCWIHKQSCIIADEMGLGKTVQTVSFLDLIYNRFGVRGPFLVVAPLSTIPHWQREFEAWTDLRVLVYHGTEVARDVMFEYEFFYKDAKTDQIIPGLCKFDVILTTYEMTLSGQNHLRNIIWRVGVFDEAHRLKNKVSKAAEVMQLFQIEHKVLLTGTPIQNSLDELFALLNFLQPHRFFSLEHFLKEYGNLKRSEDVERLQALLKPLMLRRLKEDVEKSIPVKEETIIEVELTSIQKRYYRAILEKNFGFLMKGAKSNNMPNLINTMMELRKCCIHPYLIKGAEERILAESEALESHEAQMSSMIQASGKLVLVDKLLTRLRADGHKVLIFSQMTRCLDILTDYLRWRGYPYERIDGAIRGEDRQAAIDRYCNPEKDSFVFLLCTKAGGVGINLTAADTVVIFDSDWNPQNDLQAQARCHRIGQTKSVKIYRLITRNTYEREMFDRAGMKLGLDKAILQKMTPESGNLEELSESGGAPQMSRTQVEELLKRGAYGILMENDDDGTKFMAEDIDSILARRTTVIKHDVGGGESRSVMDGSGSIFSKASFAATADDLDIDMDDPNFWEIWAKKMNLDPRHVHSSGVAAAVDESRIRRVLRRLQTHSKADFALTLQVFSVQTAEVEAEAEAADAPAKWTESERNSFVGMLMRFGLSRFDRIIQRFPNRSQNDLLACAKVVLKTCIEQVADEEPKFKEDSEKLLLSKIEFERYDKKTARQAALEGAAEDEPSGGGEFGKADVPYAGANKTQIIEYRSFYRGEECPEGFRAALKEHSRNILIALQIVEMVKTIVEETGGAGASGESGSAEALAGLSIPNSAGHGPTEWWDRDDDLALLVGTLRHGFGHFELVQTDSSLAWYHRIEAGGEDGFEFPEASRLFERLVRVVIAIEKRNRASAKLAMHAATFGSGRRRGGFDEEDEEETGVAVGSRGRDDDEYMEPQEKRGRGRPRRKVRFANAAERFLSTWTRPQRAEFNRLVYSYGLPPKLEDSDGSFERHDWSRFRQLILPSGLASKSESADEDSSAEEGNSSTQDEASRTISGKSDAELDEYSHHYLASCRYAADRPSRRRGRPSKAGRIVDEDEEEEYAFTEEEEDGGREAAVPDGLVEMAPERARKSLSRVELFARLREVMAREWNGELAEMLAVARRSSGVPRWWENGIHDAALLRGAAEFGFGRPDLLIGSVPEFNDIYKQVENGSLSVRLGGSGESAYPVIEGVDPQRVAWPNELIVLRRVELLVELLEQIGESKPEAAAKTKRGRKAKTELNDGSGADAEAEAVSERKPKAKPKARAASKREAKADAGTEAEAEAEAETAAPRKARAPKTKEAPASPSKRRSARAELPDPEEFPKAQSGRKRQKAVTDFFGKK